MNEFWDKAALCLHGERTKAMQAVLYMLGQNEMGMSPAEVEHTLINPVAKPQQAMPTGNGSNAHAFEKERRS